MNARPLRPGFFLRGAGPLREVASVWIWVMAWYGALSLVTFLAFGLDKRRSLRGQWRIPEARLHLCELLGGWPGAVVAQQFFRHKRRKASYQVVLWLIIALHLGIGVMLLWRG